MEKLEDIIKQIPDTKLRAIVHGNRELIRLYEEKVKKVIERVWES